MAALMDNDERMIAAMSAGCFCYAVHPAKPYVLRLSRYCKSRSEVVIRSKCRVCSSICVVLAHNGGTMPGKSPVFITPVERCIAPIIRCPGILQKQPVFALLILKGFDEASRHSSHTRTTADGGGAGNCPRVQNVYSTIRLSPYLIEISMTFISQFSMMRKSRHNILKDHFSNACITRRPRRN